MTPLECAALSVAAFTGIGVVVVITKLLQQRAAHRRIMAEYMRSIER